MNADWEPVASQGQVALETTFLPPGWDVGVAADLTSSYARGKVEDDPDLENVTFEGSTSELDVGARFVADLTRGVVPVTASVGAGLCSMTATFSGEEDGQVIEDSGSGTGYWLSAGVHLRMLEHLNLGLSMRVSRADVEVFGIRSNAGGGQFGFTVGAGSSSQESGSPKEAESAMPRERRSRRTWPLISRSLCHRRFSGGGPDSRRMSRPTWS